MVDVARRSIKWGTGERNCTRGKQRNWPRQRTVSDLSNTLYGTIGLCGVVVEVTVTSFLCSQYK